MTKDHFEKLERMYLNANFNTHIYDTTIINIKEEKAEISLEIHEKYHHALGAIHGSVYFKMLDDAAFFAVNSIVTDVFVLTTNFNINLLRPVTSGKITSFGAVKFNSKNLFVAESRLVDDRGKEVAFGSGQFAKSRVPLTAEIGYQ